MTLSSGDDPQDDAPKAGTALVATDDFAGIAPFTAMAAEEAPRPRGIRTLLLDYSAHAAMIVGLIGFAWTVSDHVVNRPPAPPAEKTKVSRIETAPLDSMAELRQTNAAMAQDIKALRATVESMKTGLAAAKADTGAALAQLSGRMDKLQREAALKEAPAKEASPKTAEVERAPKVERQATDTDTTGSLPPSTKTAPVPPARPQQATLAQVEDRSKGVEEPGKAQIIAGYVVRDVYDRVALIEGKRGSLEVVPGVSVPGAGIVKSIDRHGNGWTVTTTKGVIAYAGPARETHRSARDVFQYQPSYRYDF